METEQQQPLSSLEEAKKVLAEMRAENDRREKLLERDERLRAEQLISGKADAGQPHLPPKEETPLEYKNRVLRGGV